jgi:hypothetical protein
LGASWPWIVTDEEEQFIFELSAIVSRSFIRVRSCSFVASLNSACRVLDRRRGAGSKRLRNPARSNCAGDKAERNSAGEWPVAFDTRSN